MSVRQVDREGYLFIDHRNSPGLTDRQLYELGEPLRKRQEVIEKATYRCNHCHAMVVKNPKRERQRGYCPKCSSNVCDACEARRVASGGECMPLDALIDQIREREEKKLIVRV